jgi:HSP20 family molecular chaperone IbpA
MVFRNLFETDPFFNSFFFGLPQEAKPPRVVIPEYVDKKLKNYTILYALAGFRDKDLKVYSKKNLLIVEGNSDKEDSLVYGTKFSCDFKHEYNVSDKLDLTNLKATFENGLLKIILPIKAEVEADKIVHFGN